MLKMNKQVNFKNINITDGFWKNRQSINETVTVNAVYNQFKSTRFKALECNWDDEKDGNIHYFWDSDVAKWIEGAAYIIEKTGNKELKKICDEAIDNIVKNQCEDGYFNSYFIVRKDEKRFFERDQHELYCAGHLFEAAVAYFNATGKDALLKAMCKYADHIYKVFVEEDSAAFVTCGHPEIELALYRLYNLTKNEKHLKLFKFFVEKRGNNDKDTNAYPEYANEYYDQHHMPLKEQKTAEGHAVRAMYMYCAMADMAELTGDKDYLEACKTIFENVINEKMYITGGIGSTYHGEAFTKSYFLPNDTSYAETCAAISFALFCMRMQKLTVDSRYADIVERIIYNGFLSGVSLDGKAFFYENANEVDPQFYMVDTSMASKKGRRHVPIMERVELFWCSCCPPNVIRFIASIGDLMYNYNENTLFVHQFMSSESDINGTKVIQKTNYPNDGKIKIKLENSSFEKIAVRLPSWCKSFTADKEYELKNGYLYFNSCDEININFEMKVKLIQANLNVQNNAGRVAVTYGPFVYCLEEADNGKLLRSIAISPNNKFKAEYNKDYNAPVLTTTGFKKKQGNELYSEYTCEYEEIPLKFIPYFAFANRGANEMVIWVGIK